MRNQWLAMVVLSSAVLWLGPTGALADDRGVDHASPLMIAEDGGAAGNIFDYQFWDVPGRSGGAPTMLEQRESGRFVVSKTAADTWSVNERAGHFGIGEAVVIPQTTTTAPQDLWSLDAGAGYNHHFANNRDFGLRFNLGSDSDHPFYSLHETVFRVNASYRVPSGEQNSWLFFLNYSNNRYFFNNVPLPGVGYFFKADDNHLQGIVGFPFAALSYHPTPEWGAQFSLFGPRNISAEISRRLVGPVILYTAFQWNSQEWLIADRQDYSDRLFFDKKRVALGLRSPLPHGFSVDVSGGRQFDQKFFIHDSSRTNDVPVAGLSPAWFIQTRLSYRFGLPQ